MLSFIDDTQVRVSGLDEILADLYSEGRQANGVTKEIGCAHSGYSAEHLIPSFLIFRHRVVLSIPSSRAVASLL